MSASTETAFTLEVIRLIKLIPRGRVATYGQIAELAGRPWASRGVSMVANARGRSESLPWHRLVNVGGRIKFAVGSAKFRSQTRSLRAEDVLVVDGYVDLARFRWQKKLKAIRSRSIPRLFG